MRIARKLGLDCGHFTGKDLREWSHDRNSMFQYHVFAAPILGEDKEYCDICNDFKVIVRVNLSLAERDIPELT